MKEVFDALRYAITKHKDQYRKSSDGKKIPYVVHPLEVCSILYECGVRDTSVLVAAVLHDTLEDTDATYDGLVNQFGAKAASIVKELTDDKTLTKKEQKIVQVKKAPYLSVGAKLIKLADKTSNVTDIRRWPPNWSKRAMLGYIGQATEVADAITRKHVPDALWTKFWDAHKWTLRFINAEK